MSSFFYIFAVQVQTDGYRIIHLTNCFHSYLFDRLHKPKPAAKPGPKSYTESETFENVDDEIMAELEELMGPATTEGGSPIGVPKSGEYRRFCINSDGP